MRATLEDNVMFNPNIKKGFKMNITTVPGTANATLTADMGPVIQMVPTAARDITLPVVTADMKGLTYIIQSGAAFAPTVKNAAGTTITTALANAGGIVTCTGEVPTAAGWSGG